MSYIEKPLQILFRVRSPAITLGLRPLFVPDASFSLHFFLLLKARLNARQTQHDNSSLVVEHVSVFLLHTCMDCFIVWQRTAFAWLTQLALVFKMVHSKGSARLAQLMCSTASVFTLKVHARVMRVVFKLNFVIQIYSGTLLKGT